MKTTISIVICAVAAQFTFAATDFVDVVDGVTWHYKKWGSYAIIQPPNIDNIQSANNYTLLPAHEGQLPRILTIPAQLGGLDVYAVATGSIQLSDNSGVELIIVPSTIQAGISATAILGDFIKSELFSSAYYNPSPNPYAGSRYKWFFENVKEYGVKGVLFLGGEHYHYSPYNSGYEVIKISGSSTTVIIVDEDGSSSRIWPQVYYVEGVVEPYAGEIEYGVCYGAAKVEIAPVGGAFEGSIDVALKCTNSTANIYYTLDGSEPTTNVTDRCFVYNEPITLTHAATVKALAHVAEYPYTVVYSERYALGHTLTPSILATDDLVFNWPGYKVTLSCETENAEIRYTLDGSEPMEESALYTGPFAIDDTTTVKAKAYKTDWFESETATATFTREWYTVETPVITPDDTMFENTSQEVSIGCDTDGATIYYTIDGSDPRENGREYKHPFMVYNTCTVRAIAAKDDWKDSAEATATFTRGETLSAAANLYGYTMETGESAWTVDGEVSHDGVSSIKSSGDGSYVQTSVRGAGTLSFWWRAMCEEPDGGEYYDYGVFKVGGTDATYIAGNDTGWLSFSTNITTTGKHTLRWEYRKDDEGTFAPDCVWVDQVQWVPEDGSGTTLTTPEPVPYSWFAKYQLGGASDFETLGNSASGKIQGGHPTSMWEEYVAGTDPTDEDDVLKANISFDEEGKPVISALPKLTDDEIAMRLYRRYGKVTLNDAVWTEIPDGEEDNYNFFKISVEMK